MLDYDEVRAIAKSNEASVAKVKIQEYCKQHGFKLSRSNTSVKAMMSVIMDHLDDIANGKSGHTLTGAPVLESQDQEPLHATKPLVIESKNLVIDSKLIELNNDKLLESESVDPIKDIYIPTQIEIKPTDSLISERYVPKHDLIGRSVDAYINVPYWITDWIVSVNSDWKYKIAEYDGYDKEYLTDMIYYIKLNGKVIVRESRNSAFHHFY